MTPSGIEVLQRFGPEIEAIRAHVTRRVDPEAHVFHGPAHWARVAQHAQAISAALQVSPLVPVLFAWVHDSQRLNDGHDAWHGLRAARFVAEHRATLFAFLSESDGLLLQHACEKHSDGLVSDQPVLQACWDADRLDLGRVGTVPDPAFMGSAFAKRPEVIRFALRWASPQGGWLSDAGCAATVAPAPTRCARSELL